MTCHLGKAACGARARCTSTAEVAAETQITKQLAATLQMGIGQQVDPQGRLTKARGNKGKNSSQRGGAMAKNEGWRQLYGPRHQPPAAAPRGPPPCPVPPWQGPPLRSPPPPPPPPLNDSAWADWSGPKATGPKGSPNSLLFQRPPAISDGNLPDGNFPIQILQPTAKASGSGSQAAAGGGGLPPAAKASGSGSQAAAGGGGGGSRTVEMEQWAQRFREQDGKYSPARSGGGAVSDAGFPTSEC